MLQWMFLEMLTLLPLVKKLPRNIALFYYSLKNNFKYFKLVSLNSSKEAKIK